MKLGVETRYGALGARWMRSVSLAPAIQGCLETDHIRVSPSLTASLTSKYNKGAPFSPTNSSSIKSSRLT